MPRGKNYVNQNKGMTLQASSAADIKEQCYYGAQCQRKDCIYKHDGIAMTLKRTNEPCMAHLAGLCSFTDKTCRKRHVPDEEANALRAKYGAIKCRFQGQCKTKGCLYIHATDDDATATTAAATCTIASGSNGSNGTNGKNALKFKKKKALQQSTLSPLEEPNAFPPLPTVPKGDEAKNGTTEPPASMENGTASSAPMAWGPQPLHVGPVVSAAAVVAATPATAAAAAVAPVKSTLASTSNQVPVAAPTVRAATPMAWSAVTKQPPAVVEPTPTPSAPPAASMPTSSIPAAPPTSNMSPAPPTSNISPAPPSSNMPPAPPSSNMPPAPPSSSMPPALHSSNMPPAPHSMYGAPMPQAYAPHMMYPPMPPYPMSMHMMDPYHVNPAAAHYAPEQMHHMHHGPPPPPHYWPYGMTPSVGSSHSNESLNIHAKEFVPGGATH